MKLALNKIKHSTLYVVSTPIGNLADITFRAIDILKSVDFIAVESVKNSQKLLMKFNIKTKLLKVNKFNENYSSENVLEILSRRKSVAIITDAGTPSISDPGGAFVNNILNGGYKVVPIPGACSLTCALSVCGLSYSQFIFHIYKVKSLKTILLSSVMVFLGISIEILQIHGFINGTFDFYDIFSYIILYLTILLIQK